MKNMKIPYKLIFIGVLVLSLVAIFKDRPGEDLTAVSDLPTELSNLPTQENSQETVVDFAICRPDDGFKIDFDLGSSSLKLLGPDQDYCLTQATYEIEGGYYINECQVPLSLGRIVFTNGAMDPITEFCTIKSSGGGLLELE